MLSGISAVKRISGMSVKLPLLLWLLVPLAVLLLLLPLPCENSSGRLGSDVEKLPL